MDKITPCKRTDVHELHHWYTQDMPAGSWHYCPGNPPGISTAVLGPDDILFVSVPVEFPGESLDVLAEKLTGMLGLRWLIVRGLDSVVVRSPEASS